jgi:hypothetical protein
MSEMGEIRNAFKILNGKPQRKTPLWRRRHSCEGNIKTDHRKTVCKDIERIVLLDFIHRLVSQEIEE